MEPEPALQTLTVALVAPNIRRRDGQGRVMVEIARALAHRGHRTIAFSSSCAEELHSLPQFSWRRVPLPPGPEGLGVILWAYSVRRALLASQIDVVCLMGGCTVPPEPIVYYAPFAQRTWQTIRHRTTAPGLYQKLIGRFAVGLEARAVGRAGAVVPMTEAIGNELRPLIRADAVIQPVPAGVDLDEFPPVTSESRQAARSELGIDRKGFVLGFVGEYITGRKGLDLLAKGIALGSDRAERVLVHGDGPLDKANRMLGQLGIGERFLFPDPAIPVPKVMAATDAVVIPSTYEPFSLVALEAASSQLPIVISQFAGAAEFLGDAALSVDPFDAKAMRNVIDQLKNDSALRLTLGERARAVAEKTTWEIVSGQVIDVIEDAAKRANSRP